MAGLFRLKVPDLRYVMHAVTIVGYMQNSCNCEQLQAKQCVSCHQTIFYTCIDMSEGPLFHKHALSCHVVQDRSNCLTGPASQGISKFYITLQLLLQPIMAL